MRISLMSLLLLLSFSAFAEYRAYLLQISKKAAPTEAPAALGETPPLTSRQVISTLDPDQYRGYHPVKDDEIVTYTDTWMCPGRTGHFKEICPAPQRTPASVPATSSETATAP